MTTETETVTLYILRTHRSGVAHDYHTAGNIEESRALGLAVMTGRYAPDRVEIIERTITTSERAVE